LNHPGGLKNYNITLHLRGGNSVRSIWHLHGKTIDLSTFLRSISARSVHGKPVIACHVEPKA